MTDAEVEDAIDGGDRRQLRQLLNVISALQVEIELPRETPTGVWLAETADGTALGTARIRQLRGLKQATLTVLDGTGRVGLARRLFGERLGQTHVQFERLAHVMGTRGKGYSRQSVTAEDSNGHALNHRSGAAAKLRGELRTVLDRLPAGSAFGATKRVEEIMFDSGALHPDTPSMHFGALRGRNTWEQCPGALLVGAENVALEDAEAMARAFLATDPVPFVSMDEAAPKGWRWEHQWPYRATRMRRMRDGSTSPVEVPVHPDPRVQDVLELTREDELLQAFDRPRSVWHRRQFVLANELCLDLTYDAIYSYKHLVAGGNPIERACLANGFVPLTPALLHRVHPTIFRTPASAEHALRNYRQTLNDSPIWDLAVVSFRMVGQRGPEARLLIDRSRHPDPLASALAFLGPLAAFDGVSLAQPADLHPDDGPYVPGQWVAPGPHQPGGGAAPPSILMHGPPEG